MIDINNLTRQELITYLEQTTGLPIFYFGDLTSATDEYFRTFAKLIIDIADGIPGAIDRGIKSNIQAVRLIAYGYKLGRGGSQDKLMLSVPITSGSISDVNIENDKKELSDLMYTQLQGDFSGIKDRVSYPASNYNRDLSNKLSSAVIEYLDTTYWNRIVNYVDSKISDTKIINTTQQPII